MANTKTTIELNGVLYDARTGAVVSSPKRTASTVVTPKKPTNTMDGFFRKPQPANVIKPVAAKPTAVQRTVKKAPIHAHQPHKSKTLMRHAVKKPSINTPQGSETVAHTKPKPVSPAQHSHKRQERAKLTPKSSSISRFKIRPLASVEKQVAHLPVKEAPISAARHHASQAATAEASQTKSTVSFTNALQKANTHQNAKLAKPKLRARTAKKLGTTSRLITIGSISLAVVLLAGFVAYQNVPNFAMRTAATRAGFSATLPGYTPSGFAMDGAIKASPGQVTVSFRSNSDDRSYQVDQKPSNWTSQSLLTNHVAVNNQAYQTYEEKGKTIYIYNGSDATWVNGGVWYQVNGQSSLNTDQLLQIANSF